MKTISVEKFIECLYSVYDDNPTYEKGHDGSDGRCDCIGMSRGALHRAGIDDTPHMRGCNDAARNTLKNLAKIKSEKQLLPGDIVLKVRDKDDKDYPLPDQYRKGKSGYKASVGELNFTHWGQVISINPLRIMHMTSPSALIDTKLGKWSYYGQLPWINEGEIREDPDVKTSIVYADTGSTVKMRAKPSVLCKLYWDVPIGAEVVVMKDDGKWSEIIWNNRTGYMMTKFLVTGEPHYTVVIPGRTAKEADEIVQIYKGAYKEIEKG